jgi:hypothetical protein
MTLAIFEKALTVAALKKKPGKIHIFQLLRFILLPASMNGSDGDRRIWEKTKKKIQLTMLKNTRSCDDDLLDKNQLTYNQILHLCIHDAINDTHNQQG